jgi:UDP-N-acetylglucosamine--N-acetylmuramyl-(pentapeptide) pyrophosphoryl-undecaprenol N-acetylglucosamine transferase
MKLCVTGGGTGGHLMIAEAIAEAAKKEGDSVIFIGSTTGQDRKYFENSPLFDAVYFLETTGVVNQKGLRKIIALGKILKAFFTSRTLLKQHNIEATYSVGGFSAAPASLATLSLSLPLFIHEQNAVEGKLNTLLKKYAKGFVSAYDSNSPIQGYPVKEVFYETAHLRKELKTIIFLGGSQGARAINELALSVAKSLHVRGIKIIHQAGENNYESLKKAYEEMDVSVELYGFTKELPSLISRADMAVSRAGASTLWELTTNGCPAFYIPYPYAAGDHQYYNAKFIVEHDMGWCHREEEGLKDALLKALENPQLEQKSKKLLAYAKKDVVKQMLDQVRKEVV